MAKITIDPDILIKAMTAAIQAAVVGGPIERKKRGRPSKNKIEDNPLNENKKDRKTIEVPTEQLIDTEIINLEEEDLVVLDEPPEPVKQNKPSYVFNAKSKQPPEGDKKYSQVEEIDNKNRKMKFVDVAGVKHEKQDWEPTERREPVKQMKFNCNKCNRDFFEYPSNVPQAFFKVSGSTEGVHQDSALVVCPDCNTKGGTGGRRIK